MKRVLQVVTTMDLGGAETLLMNLYRNIDREKLQFDFLCHNRIESKFMDEIIALGGRMYMVPGISHVGPIKYQKNIYNFFKEHPEYDTVHTHLGELNGYILTQAKKAGVKNRYSHSHCAYSVKSFLFRIRFGYFKTFFKNSVTHAFACGEDAGKALYKGEQRRNFEVLPNGVDTERFVFSKEKRKKFRDELRLKDEIVIGHVGRFIGAKNHRFIIKVFNEMLKVNNNIHLVLVGEGELKTQTEEMVKELNIENNVHFMGSRQDIPEFLSALDLLLFPSFIEGLSVAMIEAQTSGLPILSSANVSPEVAITDRVKLLSLELSVDEWAKQAFKMINDSISVDRTVYAERVKEAGFDIKATAQKLQEFYLNN